MQYAPYWRMNRRPKSLRFFLLVSANWGKLLGAVGMKDDHLMATAVNFFCI